MKPFVLLVLATTLTWTGLGEPGFGQTKPRPVPIRRPLLLPKPIPPGKTLPAKTTPGVQKEPLANDSAAVTQKVNASKKPKLNQALALNFNRSPGSILKTWSAVHNRVKEKQRPQPPGPDRDDQKRLQAEAVASAVAQFEQDVILSKWENAKSFLGSFDQPADAKKVYNHLLTKLQLIPTDLVTPTTVPTNLPAGVVLSSPAGVKPDDHVLSPKDILGIIKLPPHELTAPEIMIIGSLVSKSIRQGFETDSLIQEFEKGLSTVGGKQASHRLNAARILLGAGRPLEAKAFLKSLAQAVAEGDIDSIVLISEVAQRQYSLQRTPELLEEAWQTNQTVLATPTAKDASRQKALKYAVELAPKVSAEIGQAWLESSFSTDPKRGIQILAGIGQATADGQKLNRHNPVQRKEGLSLQKTAVQTLLNTAPNKAQPWSQTLDMLALNWLKEAKFSQTYAKSTGRPAFRRDRYGNIYYATNDELMRRAGSSARPRPIAVQDILETRPEGKWFEVIDPGLKSEFEDTLARLYLKNSEEDKAFPYIEVIASKDKPRAKKLVDEFLQVWTRNHNPNENRGNRNQYIYFFGFEQRANSIPLTRSKQQRNLKELRQWIARLRKLEIEEIDEQALVRAFTTCHSTAEVYRLEDIEEVFGSIQALKDNTVAGLAQKMRTNLSTAWRQPRVQETKKTNRKEPEIRQEVLRGYEVAANITREALFQYPDSWELQLAQACIHFDQNAYQQEIKKSSEFTEKQRRVFDEFAMAAKTYAQQVATMKEEEQTTQVFDVWFYAALGACDLSLLTHEKLSIESQFAKIKMAMERLPGEAPTRHVSQFANKLFTRMSPLKPEMKYRYLKGGFSIVGDHPDAAEAQKVFQYYNDLVNEIELQTRIDGSDIVGEKPFGLFVNLRHTEEVERESGGFSKYLQNQNSMTYAYNYGRPTNDYRDAFETSTIAALSEHFEVISVTFEDEKNMESREASEPGWRITPYAYVLLKSRGQEVDIIPPVKLDLDFLDTSGYAVLPIESKAIPVDTKTDTPEDRPIRDLKITQTLDERRAGEGKLVLEVKATARGLIPGFNHLLELKKGGFEVIEQQDQGVSVSAFDPESNEIQMVTEREWLVELKATEEAGMPKTFEFCGATDPETQMEFKRYHDADLVDVEQVVPLENSYGQTRKGWILWLCGGAFATILALVLGIIRYRTPRPQPVFKYTRPQVITPLSVISLLQEIRSNETLGDDQIGQLDDAIQRIEQHFFDTQNVEAPNLDEETDHWLSMAN